MKLKLVRDYFTPNETLGSLYIDDKFFCYTLEDKDRNLHQDNALSDVKKRKVAHQTAIPLGTYKVAVTLSNRFKRPMPLVQDVKGFEGIRIHGGNTHFDTEGCILVAHQRNVNKVHPVIKSITNWIYGSKEKELTKLLGSATHELEIVRKNGKG